MNSNGYSGKSLVAKLGYQPEDSVCILGMPDEIKEYLHAEDVEIKEDLPASWCHAFFTWQKDLDQFLAHSDLTQIEKGLWVSWPKKAAGVTSDLTEQTFRNKILPLDWVDTKVAAIDQTWSGLKFLRRKN